MAVGQAMRMIGPKGKFMLAAGGRPDTHLHLVGDRQRAVRGDDAPALIDGRPRRVVFLNGVSYADELGYRRVLEDWQTSGAYPVTYVPTVSRPADPRNPAGWAGPAESR